VAACSVFDDQLVDYEDLSEEDRQIVDRHVIECTDCRDYVAVLRTIDSALTAACRDVRLRGGIAPAVRCQLGVSLPRLPSVWPERFDWAATMAVIACACALVWSTGAVEVLIDSL
jgi:anti-sigma factor RsiW